MPYSTVEEARAALDVTNGYVAEMRSGLGSEIPPLAPPLPIDPEDPDAVVICQLVARINYLLRHLLCLLEPDPAACEASNVQMYHADHSACEQQEGSGGDGGSA